MPATLGSRGSDPWEAALLPGYVTRVSLNYKLQFLLLLARDIDPDKQKEAELPLYHNKPVGWGGDTWNPHDSHQCPLVLPMNGYSNPSLRRLWLYWLEKKCKKSSAPKLRLMYYLVNFEAFKTRRQLLRQLWGTAQKREGRSQDIQGFCNRNQIIRTSKDHYSLKKTRHQVNEFSAFLWRKRCQSLGTLKAFFFF